MKALLLVICSLTCEVAINSETALVLNSFAQREV